MVWSSKDSGESVPTHEGYNFGPRAARYFQRLESVLRLIKTRQSDTQRALERNGLLTIGGSIPSLVRKVSGLEHDTPLVTHDSTVVSVVNTTTETTVFTKTIPANVLGVVRVNLFALVTNNSGSNRNFRVRVKLGATTMYSDTTANFASSAPERACRLVMTFFQRAAADQEFHGFISLGSPAAPTNGTGDLSTDEGASQAPFAGAATEDSTADLDLVVTIEPSAANASLEWDHRFAHCEVDRPL